MSNHTSVLLEECLEGLSIVPGGVYIDGTFGRGGHSRKILTKLDSGGRLIGIDKDPDAIAHAKDAFAEFNNFSMVHGSFADIERIAKEQGVFGQVDGILLDLGVSSPQLDKAERGFSFMKDGPLDMRMDNSQGLSASDWLMQATEEEMVPVFKRYGEEKFGTRIARAIIDARQNAPIETTMQLAKIITDAKPVKEKNKHPATKTFQAIRIFINKELEDLENVLKSSLDVLKVGGRLVIISFHSLEDRLVKRFMREQARGERLPIEVPMFEADLMSSKRLKTVSKAIKPGNKEVDANNRARSAILRIGEKIR